MGIPHRIKMKGIAIEYVLSEFVSKTSSGEVVKDKPNCLLEFSVLFPTDGTSDLKKISVICHDKKCFIEMDYD